MTDRRTRAGCLALALLSIAPMAARTQEAELSLPGADTADGSPTAPPLVPEGRNQDRAQDGRDRAQPEKVRVFLRSRRTAPVRYQGGALELTGRRGAAGAGAEPIRDSVVGASLLHAAALEALADPTHGAEEAVNMLLEFVFTSISVDLGEGDATLGAALAPPKDADRATRERAEDFREGLVQGLEEILADPLPGGLAQAAFDPIMAMRVRRWRRETPRRLARFATTFGRGGPVGAAEGVAYTGVLAVLEVAVAAAQQRQRGGWAVPVRQVGTSSVLDAAGVAHEAVVGRYADLVLGSSDRVVSSRLAFVPPLTPSTGTALAGLFLLFVWGGTLWLAVQVGRKPPTPVEVEDPLAKKKAQARAEKEDLESKAD